MKYSMGVHDLAFPVGSGQREPLKEIRELEKGTGRVIVPSGSLPAGWLLPSG